MILIGIISPGARRVLIAPDTMMIFAPNFRANNAFFKGRKYSWRGRGGVYLLNKTVIRTKILQLFFCFCLLLGLPLKSV